MLRTVDLLSTAQLNSGITKLFFVLIMFATVFLFFAGLPIVAQADQDAAMTNKDTSRTMEIMTDDSALFAGFKGLDAFRTSCSTIIIADAPAHAYFDRSPDRRSLPRKNSVPQLFGARNAKSFPDMEPSAQRDPVIPAQNLPMSSPDSHAQKAACSFEHLDSYKSNSFSDKAFATDYARSYREASPSVSTENTRNPGVEGFESTGQTRRPTWGFSFNQYGTVDTSSLAPSARPWYSGPNMRANFNKR